jgi:hypothetical protein
MVVPNIGRGFSFNFAGDGFWTPEPAQAVKQVTTASAMAGRIKK